MAKKMAFGESYKKISMKVTPAQDRFGNSIGRIVNKFVNTKSPKR